MIPTILASIVRRHPYLLFFTAGVGTMRLVVKPVMEIAHAVVKATPSTRDDDALRDLEASDSYKAFLWGVDYLASIDLK